MNYGMATMTMFFTGASPQWLCFTEMLMGYVSTGMVYLFSVLLFFDGFAHAGLSSDCASGSLFLFHFFLPPDFLDHNDHVFYRSITTMAVLYRNVDGLRLYWDGLSLQCTALF